MSIQKIHAFRHWLFTSTPCAHPWSVVHTAPCSPRYVTVRLLRRVTRQAYHDNKEPA